MFHKLVRWNEKSITKWERTREAGKRRYVWVTGVLGWGVPMFVVMTAFFYVQQRGLIWPSVEELPFVLGLIPMSALIWFIGGYWFGSTMWSTMERAYKTHQTDSSSLSGIVRSARDS
jgi:hypothetical protein